MFFVLFSGFIKDVDFFNNEYIFLVVVRFEVDMNIIG